jgi:membrane dipeptidase
MYERYPLRVFEHLYFPALALILIAPAAFAQQPRAPRTKPVTQAEVDKITREAILIDTHDDVTSRTVEGYDIATPNKRGQTDLARMKGFLGAEFFAVCT